jgi:hypothetical protein
MNELAKPDARANAAIRRGSSLTLGRKPHDRYFIALALSTAGFLLAKDDPRNNC